MKKLFALLACVGLFLGCSEAKKTDTKKKDADKPAVTKTDAPKDEKKADAPAPKDEPAPPAKEEKK